LTRGQHNTTFTNTSFEGSDMLAKFLLRAVFAAFGLWVASRIVPGVSVTETGALILAAVLLGVVNAIVRPVVTILTLPLTIITLGLFLLVVNAGMVGLVAWLIPGFRVDGLLAGVLAAIVTGAVSWLGGLALRDDRK
jgi:putative membrane protein